MNETPLSFIKSYMWLFEIAIVFIIAFLVVLVINKVYKRLQPSLKKTALLWDDALVKSLVKPIKMLVWVLALGSSLEVLSSQFSYQMLTAGIEKARYVVFLFIIIWFALRFIRNFEADYVRAKNSAGISFDKTTVRAICQISRIAVMVLISLVGMQTLGISISAVLAFGGVGALSVAWAAKDLLGNFFGSLMIFMDRPFAVGDWIRSPDRELEGTVENIGWRLTKIRTFDKRPLYVPNGVFSSVSIENPSRMSNRRIKQVVGLRYKDAPKIREILQKVTEMLKNHEEIDQEKVTFVHLIEFGPSSLNFLIYTFTKTTDWVTFQRIQEDVFLKIIDIIASFDAECAFPTRTVHLAPND